MDSLDQYLFMGKDIYFWLKISGILLVAYFGNRIIIRAFDKAFHKATARKTRTIMQVTENAITTIIAIVTGLTLLTFFNINIIPLLASASVLGFAVGFGSQSLIKDVIAGFFILTSDIFYEGDIIKVGDVTGKVEKVGIRTVTIRDLNGVVHTVPNGTIGPIANHTKDWSRANIDVGVSSDHPIDRVLEIFKEELNKLRHQNQYSSLILDFPEPTVEGIEKIEGGKIIIKTLLRTTEAAKWDIEREFLYHIKKRFEEENFKFA